MLSGKSSYLEGWKAGPGLTLDFSNLPWLDRTYRKQCFSPQRSVLRSALRTYSSMLFEQMNSIFNDMLWWHCWPENIIYNSSYECRPKILIELGPMRPIFNTVLILLQLGPLRNWQLERAQPYWFQMEAKTSNRKEAWIDSRRGPLDLWNLC